MITFENAIRLIKLMMELSFLSFGGANVIFPSLHRASVENYGWLTDSQFADCFAIAQASPGSNVLFVTLIGYAAGGVSGAFIATFAMLLPASILLWVFCIFWEKFKNSQWHKVAERSFAPLTLGLIFASGLTITRAADHGWTAYLATAISTVLFTYTKISPLWVMGIAGILGYYQIIQ